MLANTYPIRLLLMTLSGLVSRHQADVISCLADEKRVLKERSSRPFPQLELSLEGC